MSRLSTSLRISLIYACSGCAWILFSDWLVLTIFSGLSNEALTQIQNYKGIFFTFFTAILLYLLIRLYYLKHQEADEKYRQFFFQNPSPMWVYDPKTLKFMYVNQAAKIHYGYTEEDFAQMSIRDIRPETEHEKLQEYLQEKSKSFKNAGVWQHKKKDGSIIYVNVYSNDIIFNGRQLRLICSIDVTKTFEYERKIEEQKHTLELRVEERTKDLAAINEELQSYNEEMSAANETIIQQAEIIKQQSESRLNIILESITDGFFIMDEEGYILRSNSVFLKLFELEGIPAGGNTIEQIFELASKAFLVEKLRKSIANQESLLFDIFLEHSNIWLEVRTYPNKEGLFVYLLDISDFKKQQEAIRFNQQNLNALINNTEDLIWSINQNMKMVSMNDSFIQMVSMFSGRTIKIGESDLDFIDEKNMKSEWSSYYNRALAGEIFSIEQIWDQNHQTQYFDISFNPIVDHENKVIGVGCFGREITERKKAELERNKLVERLTKQNRDLEEFAFITSHNLRAPVASILGLTHIFNKEKINDPLNIELIDHLRTSAEKLDHVITDLSAILEMKSNIEDTLEELSLQETLDTILIMLQQPIENDHAEISADFSKAPSIKTNKAYLQNIIFNLVSNALKYKRKNEAPRIRIESFIKEHEIGFYVQDNGKGIDLNQFGKQIFTLYKRFHLDIEGKGVGLYLVKTQVEALGGNVRVESRENEGARFTVSLPK